MGTRRAASGADGLDLLPLFSRLGCEENLSNVIDSFTPPQIEFHQRLPGDRLSSVWFCCFTGLLLAFGAKINIKLADN